MRYAKDSSLFSLRRLPRAEGASAAAKGGRR